MQRSTDRIITSHVGSLARPLDLLETMREKVNGRPYDRPAYEARCREAVADIVRQQADAGIDVVTDGEISKPQFCDYIADRIAGFEGTNTGPGFVNPSRRPDPFPAWRATQTGTPGMIGVQERRPLCIGPLHWRDRAYETDIANLKAALQHVDVLEAFLPSPSPGILAMRIPNVYYGSEEEYLYALAGVLHDEYKAITDAGFVLQIDAPDAAMGWDRQHFETIEEFRKTTRLRTEALNHALQGIPEQQVRFHVCWGNNESPHTNDVPLRDIVDIVLQVNSACYSIEAANPRHGHEWTVWQETKLPDGKALMPGVIDSLTNLVEHPDLVAQRIVTYANLVVRENVIAGVDCGFGTGASANPRVHPEIVMAKFRTLAEGAAIASQQLWR